MNENTRTTETDDLAFQQFPSAGKKFEKTETATKEFIARKKERIKKEERLAALRQKEIEALRKRDKKYDLKSNDKHKKT